MVRVVLLRCGVAALAAILAGFAAGARWLILLTIGHGWWVELRAGRLGFGHELTSREPYAVAFGRDMRQLDWGWEFWRRSTSWDVYIPLWCPFAVVAAAVVAVWLWGRRRPAGACAACGYDLRGVGARVCPECGAGKLTN